MPVLRTSALLAALLLALLPSASRAQDQKDQKGAGITMAATPTPKTSASLSHPGARRHKDKDSDSPGINFDLWGGGSGVEISCSEIGVGRLPRKNRGLLQKETFQIRQGSRLLPSPTGNATDSNDNDDNRKPLTCGSTTNPKKTASSSNPAPNPTNTWSRSNPTKPTTAPSSN